MTGLGDHLGPDRYCPNIGFVSQTFVRNAGIFTVRSALPEFMAESTRICGVDYMHLRHLGELVLDSAKLRVGTRFDQVTHPAVVNERRRGDASISRARMLIRVVLLKKRTHVLKKRS